MNNKTSALIIARPGQLRDSLQVLLRTIPQLELVDLVDNGRAALAVDIKHQPVVVLLDLELSDQTTATMLNELKTKWSQSKYVALVETEQEEQLAKSIGVEVVLIKGVPAAKLLATIEELVSQ